jgi:hypothetical protein
MVGVLGGIHLPRGIFLVDYVNITVQISWPTKYGLWKSSSVFRFVPPLPPNEPGEIQAGKQVVRQGGVGRGETAQQREECTDLQKRVFLAVQQYFALIGFICKYTPIIYVYILILFIVVNCYSHCVI